MSIEINLFEGLLPNGPTLFFLLILAMIVWGRSPRSKP